LPRTWCAPDGGELGPAGVGVRVADHVRHRDAGRTPKTDPPDVVPCG
jgi:hypothetical protein